MQHRQYQQFWPNYTLPAVAKYAQAAQASPPAFIPGTNMPQMSYERVVMNGYGSYYQSPTGYYRNPVPYTHDDRGAPVPGWGTSVRVAGPARVGVGAVKVGSIDASLLRKAALLHRVADPGESDVALEPEQPLDEEPLDLPPEASEVGGLPWFVWPIAAAVVLGGVGYYGTTKGWF